MLPVWVQVVLAAAALSTAVGVLWKKVLLPLARGIGLIEEAVPLLRQVVEVFRDNPTAFNVLGEIAEQFRTDSGSSLRDAVDRLETAAAAALNSSDLLKVNTEASKQLAAQDRRQLERLVVLLDRLDVKVTDATATGHRIEDDRSMVAAELAASQERADLAIGDPGAAADAAAVTPE